MLVETVLTRDRRGWWIITESDDEEPREICLGHISRKDAEREFKRYNRWLGKEMKRLERLDMEAADRMYNQLLRDAKTGEYAVSLVMRSGKMLMVGLKATEEVEAMAEIEIVIRQVKKHLCSF